MAPPHIFAGACVNCALSTFTASASYMNASFSRMRVVLFCDVFLPCGVLWRCVDIGGVFVALGTFLKQV